EPRVLKGRRGGTDEFLGRGMRVPQSPESSGPGGRPIDKCLVPRHADALIRKSPATVSAAVNSSPVRTPRKEKNLSAVRCAPVDKRGHIRVRRRLASPVSPQEQARRRCVLQLFLFQRGRRDGSRTLQAGCMSPKPLEARLRLAEVGKPVPQLQTCCIGSRP